MLISGGNKALWKPTVGVSCGGGYCGERWASEYACKVRAATVETMDNYGMFHVEQSVLCDVRSFTELLGSI